MLIKKLGILTAGGDAPGMNAAVRAVVLAAEAQGIDVVGIRGGYRGLLEKDVIDLNPNNVAGTISHGGTWLWTDRCKKFESPEGVALAVANCRAMGIDAIVVVGGDGTFRGGRDLTNAGVPTVGIPGTIDNDVTASDYTIGFDTAMNTALGIIDKLRDTCESHARCNIVEVMGRDCGQIALLTGIASGAIGTAIPEMPFDEEAFIEKARAARESGKRSMLVVVSEGIITTTDGTVYEPSKYGEHLAKRMNAELGRETKWDIETKFCRIAHTVRGGDPTLRDRLTATRMGCKAVELLLEGKSNRVVVEQGGEIVDLDLLWSLALDDTRKNKLKEHTLDPFSKEELDAMQAALAEWKANIASLYEIANICGK